MQRHAARLTSALLCICVTLIPCASPAQTPDTIRVRLETAVRHALDVSPEVNAVASTLDFAQARERLARASRFATEFSLRTAHAAAPGLRNLPAGVSEDNLYLYPGVRNDWESLRPLNRFETSLVQPLYTWGALQGNIEAARQGVRVEEASVGKKKIEIALRTGTLYYNLLLAKQLVTLTEQAGEIVEQAKTEIDRLLEEGAEDVDDADLFKVRITEQEFLRRVVEVEQGLRTAQSALARQLMLPGATMPEPEEIVLEPMPFVLDSLDAYLRIALEHRPEIGQATAGLAAREAQIRVARADYFPQLFLGVDSRITLTSGRFRQPNPYVNDPYLGRSLRAGIGLRLPLNMVQTRARVAQAKAERNEVRHQLAAARQLILFEVEAAWRNVITARAAMDAQREALTISGEWLRTEQINFDLDLGDTENLVDAVRANLALRATYYERVRAFNVAVLRLWAETGWAGPGPPALSGVLPE